jgi:hypothetical protein
VVGRALVGTKTTGRKDLDLSGGSSFEKIKAASEERAQARARRGRLADQLDERGLLEQALDRHGSEIRSTD